MADPLALFLARLQLDERLATEARARTVATYSERDVSTDEQIATWEAEAAELPTFATGGLVPAGPIRLPDRCAGLRAAMATEDTAGRSPFRFDDLSQLLP